MPGILYVVPTPIGNLEDITLRALRVLREVDAIAAEDTRHTAKLLSHHGVPTRTLSFHQHNIRSRLPGLLARLEAGESIALVTDAGTPGVSDPGTELVQACWARQIPIDVLPGASAPMTAAVASGFPLSPMTVLGFSPSRSKDRSVWMTAVAAIPHTVTFFEAPHRILTTLTEAAVSWGERQIVVARELTKAHQQLLRGSAVEIIRKIGVPRGEFTVVVGPAAAAAAEESQASDDEVVAEFWRTTESGSQTRRQAIAAVAQKYGRSVRDVYSAVERLKKSGQ